MEIAKIFKSNDYLGLDSYTVFVSGCNYRCPWCYNKDLVYQNLPIMSEKQVSNFFKKEDNIKYVVLCGGEPTIYDDLPEFCMEVKSYGYKIKLNTNGSNPNMISDLIRRKLIDYVQLDIKSPVYHIRYEKDNKKTQKIYGMCFNNHDDFYIHIIEKIQETLTFLIISDTPYQLKTIEHPYLTDEMKKDIQTSVKTFKLNHIFEKYKEVK